MRSRSATSWALLRTRSAATGRRVSHLQPQDSLSLGVRPDRHALLPILVSGDEDGQGNRGLAVMRQTEPRAKRAVSALASIEPSAAATGVGRSLTNAIGVVGAAVCALSVVFVVRSVPAEEAIERGVLEFLVVGVPIGAGLYALRVPRNARFGFALIAAGFAWSLTALGEASESLPYSIGRVSGWLVFPSLIYLMLAFPDGRVARGVDRGLYRSLNALLWFLFVGSALFVEQYPTHTPWAMCVSDCPPNAFLALNHEPASMGSLVQPAREGLAIILFAAVLVSMARRWHRATPLRRRTMLPVMGTSAVSTMLLAAFF